MNATEDDLVEMMKPLWAILMWGNREKHILKVIEENGLDYLRKKLSNLLYGSDAIEVRWDDFRKNVKGMGPAIMSELLCKAYSDKFILWNVKAVNAFKALDIKVPNYHSLVLNLMKAKTNKAVQGIVAVTDEEQIEKIKKEIAALPQIRDEVKFWNYKDVIATHTSLTNAMKSINRLELVPDGMIKRTE